ncbi:MAG: response regulator transcription factor [Clostridia bacterium]|nr:response regulator transcription factor [Clostridia bacterium]
MSTKKILVVEDEKPISDILKFNLVKSGYEVLCAYDGEEGLNLALSESVDLMLLDVMLPKMEGFDVLKKVREKKQNMPILMLTAREEEVDKILGLEWGADDYITKPFSMRELLARVKANLRRIVAEDNSPSGEVAAFGNLEINYARYEVMKNGDIVELTLREYELLKFLSTQPGMVFSREMLLEKVWGYEYFGDVRTVDVTIRRLREKIEDDPAHPLIIMTKRGIGYYLNK